VKRIFVSSASNRIKNIAKDEGVNHFESEGGDIEERIVFFANKTKSDVIIWVNATAPFLGHQDYKKMYEAFLENKCDLLLTVSEKQDYAFFNNQKINFKKEFIDRSSIDPIYICTNGAYIFEREYAIKQKNLLDSENLYYYKLNKFTSIEIKNILDYSISKELITMFFSEALRDK
jgi:CMP-N-acetylneuraminic acid synthetase